MKKKRQEFCMQYESTLTKCQHTNMSDVANAEDFFFFFTSRSMSTEDGKIDIDGGCDAITCYAVYCVPISNAIYMPFTLIQTFHLGHVQIG